jgi:hypothetical protein
MNSPPVDFKLHIACISIIYNDFRLAATKDSSQSALVILLTRALMVSM